MCKKAENNDRRGRRHVQLCGWSLLPSCHSAQRTGTVVAVWRVWPMNVVGLRSGALFSVLSHVTATRSALGRARESV